MFTTYFKYWFVSILLLCYPSLQTAERLLTLNLDKTHDLNVTYRNAVWEIHTTGNDPFINTLPISPVVDIAKTPILSFDYLSVDGCENFELFVAPPWGKGHTITINLPPREGWSPATFDLRTNSLIRNASKINQFRLDPGNKSHVNIHIKNICLRPATPDEERSLASIEQLEKQKLDHENRLQTYLTGTYPGSIDRIKANENTIFIHGQAPSSEHLYIAEWPVWQAHTQVMHFENVWPITETSFSFTCPRKNSDGTDRLYSRFVLIHRDQANDKLLSHAHWVDEVPQIHVLPYMKPHSKKGIGGFHLGRGYDSDLDELGIGCLTYNFSLAQLIQSKPNASQLTISCNGKSWYLNDAVLQRCDDTMIAAAQRKIVMLGILLIPPAHQWPAKDLGTLLQHPDYEAGGIYTMPNLTTKESTQVYIALLEFLARRYTRSDGKYGRVHHWIMHNEVDMGYVWTNCGTKPPLSFFDHYYKSMRLGHLILQQQDQYASAFISLTHHWSSTTDPERCHPSLTLLKHLVDLSHAEGNFSWGLAYHPYPSSLREPKTWLDKDATFNFNTPKITFHNIEVLDAYMKQPRLLYKGQTRTIHLSEQGPNSPDYSDKSLQEQAAAMAYVWQKINRLDSIHGFEFHNWFDNRKEGGIRIGLRRFPDDETDPGGTKPVWHVYKALGTEQEAAATAFALPMIGLSDWSKAFYTGDIK